MTSPTRPTRLNLTALAQAGAPMAGQAILADLPRLAADVPDHALATAPVSYRATAGADPQLWLHLQAQAEVPLSCQRCLAPAAQAIEVDQWFRFVATEAEAEAQDDEAEEDLLVLEPQFDLLALLEDELLMALPLVPMHEQCPSPPSFQAGEAELPPEDAKPHPFAALAQLKKKGH
jgi:uncharacterized protein